MAYLYAWTTASPVIDDLVSDGAQEIREGVKAAIQERIQSVIANIDNDPWQFKNIQAAITNTYDIGSTTARFKAGYVNALAINTNQVPSAGNILLANTGTIQSRNAADIASLNMLSMNASNVLQLYNGAATLTTAGVMTATTFVGALTGNASSTSILQTARTINGVAFDGSANISITSTSTGTLTFGTHLTSGGGSYNGSANVTITSDATSANTASTIVARDGSGNFTATTITAALVGNASTATSATTAGTVTTAAQPAITSVGTLTSLATSGTITVTTAALDSLIGNINNAVATTYGMFTAQRQGTQKFAIGINASDIFTIFSAAGGNQNFTLSDAGAGTFRAGLTIAGTLTGVTTLTTSSTINSQTISATAAFTGTVSVATALSIGATPATASFAVRLASTAGIGFRNAANNANITMIECDASDHILIDSNAKGTIFGAGITATSITLSADSSIASTKKFYWDGVSDTYTLQSSDNILDFYIGGTRSVAMRNPAGTPLLEVADPGTTGTAANTVLAAGIFGYAFLRTSSSLRYKKNVQDMTLARAANVILRAKPVTYNSRSTHDDSSAIFVGFLAEEIAEIDNCFVVMDQKGRPDSVQYDRFVAPLVLIVQDHESRIRSLEARLH